MKPKTNVIMQLKLTLKLRKQNIIKQLNFLLLMCILVVDTKLIKYQQDIS